jgi:hypothetical protein
MGLDLIDRAIAKLEDFEQNVDLFVMLTASEFEEFIVDLNRSQMEDKGIRGNSTKITPKYVPFTIKVKKAKGQVFSHVTLTDTGDFSDAMFVEFGDDFFFLGSEDIKTQELVAKYGKEIFGLTKDNQGELSQEMKDSFVKAFRKKITA